MGTGDRVCLKKPLSKQPNNPDPYFHLGQAYQGAGKHKEAVEVLAENDRAQSVSRHTTTIK